MLAKLTVKNFALVSSLELEFGERLNILSGETGAGKSIIVDSITMLVGGRYDKTMLRFGESSGYVEGVFTVTDRVREAVSDYLDDGDDQIIVLRKFNSDGKNEIRINGRSATLGMLKSIGAALVGARRWGRGARASLDDPSRLGRLLRRLCGHRAVRTVAYDSDVPLTGREPEASYGEHSRWCRWERARSSRTGLGGRACRAHGCKLDASCGREFR